MILVVTSKCPTEDPPKVLGHKFLVIYINVFEFAFKKEKKKKEWSIATFHTTWTNLEHIVLGSQSQKTLSCMIPFIWNIWNKKICKDKM